MKFIILTLTVLISLTLYSQNSIAKTLVIIGDSLTEGLGVAKEKAFPALIEEKLKTAKKDWKVINSGVSGSTTASAISRVRWILKSKPDMVMIALGANDGLRGVRVQTSKQNLDDAMALIKKENISMIVVGMQLPPNFGKQYTADFKNMFSDLAKKYDATFIPFLLDKVAGNSKLNLSDGIHPNEEGHKIMAETVYSHIQGILK